MSHKKAAQTLARAHREDAPVEAPLSGSRKAEQRKAKLVKRVAEAERMVTKRAAQLDAASARRKALADRLAGLTADAPPAAGETADS